MPPVYNVSQITNILSSAIQHPSLQDVWIRGKILKILPPNILNLGLDLGGERYSIDCPYRGDDAALFKNLIQGTKCYAYGRVSVNAQKSEYRFDVTKIQCAPPIAFMNILSLTRKIKQAIDGLGRVQVQAKISSVARYRNRRVLNLKDANANREMIECAIPAGIPGIALNRDVRVRGEIDIFPRISRYQIRIAGAGNIMFVPNLARCQCPGCGACEIAPPCDRLREVANFEACATCLPRPPDELYELCPQCYAFSPDHETRVAAAVYAYFDELRVNGFSPDKEGHIQFGARNGSADVVLVDQNGSFAAIAECKGAGYVGRGIEQLKSYLSATDTRFGIFANRADPDEWKFYENLRRNCIHEIARSEFEEGVVEGIAHRERLRDRIAHLNSEIARLENQRSELDTDIERVSQIKRNLIERTSNLERQVETQENYQSELREEIHQALDEIVHLEGEIARLKNQKSELRTAIRQLSQTEQNLVERTSDLTQYQSELQREIYQTLVYQTLDELLERKMQRLERPLIELQERGIVNWFKNLFSKENE